ncbi:uncharacterized protein LOC121652139 [Melanotaenia boesemani]|uniref:uncharacterized protein LOC121652139 n=1 Tax=Melanotaenia boesemani TaxID=1250792 RepID=UPI001C046C38|nr:uncharacterized protein LOC121652139 [Melanotaenia boesemani]XP_041860682.1 uncharacterized protein LOC121652139 [Melanotaenia boesemani]
MNILIKKIGPRVKFRKRLRDYLQDPSPFPPHLESTSGSDRDDRDKDVDQEMNEELIYPGASVTREHGLLATILFILRHQLTSTVQTGFIALLNFLIPNLLVESQQLPHNIHAVFYCEGCQNYLGKNPTSCFHCNTICKNTSSFQSGNFFLFSPLKDLLKDLLENHGTDLLPKTENKHGHDIKDVKDGMMYQNLLKRGILGVDDLTLTWNCDGVPIYEPRFSIWPLQFTINELPYTQRTEHVMVAGLWFGRERPNMDVLLKPFVDECCDLAQNPFDWKDSSGKVRSSKVFSLICSSDAVARPLLRNCKQFNGEHGCDWCLHPGLVVKKGSGSTRSYPYDEIKQAARSKMMFEDNAREAESTGSPVNGVKGRSLLSPLPFFDIVSGFVPEYVHSVLLGVSKQLMSLWLDPVNSVKAWYLGDKTEQMDSRLHRLKRPTEISQPPQSVKCWDLWKASEWRAFLLFYAISVLPGILHPTYVTHYLYLSFSIHILLQESVSEYDLQLAREYLKRYVKDMETFYGEENMSFNCHQLIHLVDSVQHCGPLWATSAFPFERNNRHLRWLLTNIDYNPGHIYQRFLFWQHIPSHINSLTFNHHLEFGELLSKLLPENDGDRSYKPLGNSHHPEITGSIKLAIEELLNQPVVVRRAEAFNSFKKGNTVYSSANSKESDRADSVVRLRNGFCGEMHLMLLFKENCCCTSKCLCQAVPIIVAHMYDIEPEERLKYINHDDASKMIFVRVKGTEQPKAFYLDDVRCKCMNVDGWLVPLPNSYERY